MKAYHFLRDDMTAGYGNEPAWKVGETRTYDGEVKLCEAGYHASPSWYDALGYAPGNVACIVEVTPIFSDESKCVSQSRTLTAAANVERALREWACDCAERALRHVENPDPRSVAAIEVARRYVRGEATSKELDAARAAAMDAALDAAMDAAWAAAWAAARAGRAAAMDAWAAARAGRAAEIAWQREALNARLDAVFAAEAV